MVVAGSAQQDLCFNAEDILLKSETGCVLQEDPRFMPQKRDKPSPSLTIPVVTWRVTQSIPGKLPCGAQLSTENRKGGKTRTPLGCAVQGMCAS